ncbi:unnamed protein product [Alopecurus aequalis]
MERYSSSSLSSAVALLALICCSLLCSASSQVALDGNRVGQDPPSPYAPRGGGYYGGVPGSGGYPGYPPSGSTSALAPHRKNLQVATSNPYV